ncbi:MAG: hypothetical protein HOD92_03475 [Deltaproteobacteria bacterium]|mgnify:CR=1|jgi:hypothetical protein|nr:hypothetical protein [Deltaproteobacteria bacterium]
MNVHRNELWLRDHQEQLLKEARAIHRVSSINNNPKTLRNRLNKYIKNSFLLKNVF